VSRVPDRLAKALESTRTCYILMCDCGCVFRLEPWEASMKDCPECGEPTIHIGQVDPGVLVVYWERVWPEGSGRGG
jgi:hypothetical protein